MSTDWLTISRGNSPLIVSMPHTGTEIPHDIEQRLVSPWLARKDADWWIDRLYSFVEGSSATIIRTSLSRTVIDVNRDPSGKSLYPGQATTELCPTTTFDGEPLYKDGCKPSNADIAHRLQTYHRPYHNTLGEEITRLKREHRNVVLFDAHSIRSRAPRLFEGELPHLNLGTNGGASCSPVLTQWVERICSRHDYSRVTNGRFRGGYITRHYGNPSEGVHAIQLELAMRAYMNEPEILTSDNWPPPFEDAHSEPLRALLSRLLATCLGLASEDQL